MELQVADENQLELVVSNPGATAFRDLLNSQKDLFRGQIDELENIVLNQCRLTGVNPLSQEMAAGALSIQIGKRPRDLLNPKAVKYMQSVFSVKDAITKKETREISALYGVTATQVRDFFATQRSRVRKSVRLSQEKANRSSSSKEMHDGAPLSSDYNDPLTPVPLDSVAPITTELGPTCLTQDEVLPTEDQSDKYFIDNILSLMRKEESFSGQVKLTKWIMQIQNASVLYWFLTNGGVMILATWLTQALFEEQTSVLRVILKVLCHLPLQKSLPVHMSAILQSVNSLRFYRASDISNRARILLTRWSKTFASSQALRKTNGTKSASDSQDEILLKKSISEVMGNESWHANMDNLEDSSYAMDESPGIIRKLESQPLKLLTASADDPNKKLIRGALSSQNRERRKVLLVEQPGQKSTGRTSQIARSTTSTKGRPLSADDIQKAKIRAQFMQSKYHKTNATSDTRPQMQPEGSSKSASSQISTLAAAPKMRLCDEIEEPRKCGDLPLEVTNQKNTSDDNKINPKSDESPSKKCKRFQIQWQTPPEIHINVSWSVGAGEHSKEVEVQKNRIHRERETVYKTLTEIPSNPKEPWDREIDYDDTLTPEIPFEQLPDVESAQVSVSARRDEGTAGAYTFGAQNAVVMPEPDLELLAALLKNPELVFALTSGRAGNMSNEETVKLLDTIRANEINTLASIGASSGKGKLDDKVEVSLPSPTPSMDAATSAWKPDYAKKPFSQQKSMAKHEAQSSSAVPSHEKIPAISIVQPGAPPSISTLPKMEQLLIASALRSEEKFRAGGSGVQPQMQPAGVAGSQGSETLEQLAQLLPQVYGLHEQRFPAITSASHHNFPVYTANGNAHRPPASEFLLNTSHAASVSRLPQIANSHCAVVAPASHIDNMGVVSPSIPMLTTSTLRSQTQLQPSYTPLEAPPAHSWWPRQGLDPSHSVYQSTVNRNEYNTFVGAPVRGSMPLGSWEKNDMMMDEQDFESWSPEHSPMRSRNRYMPGWSSQEPRVSQAHGGYRPERSIPRHSSGYPSTSGYQELGRNEGKRWRDRR